MPAAKQRRRRRDRGGARAATSSRSCSSVVDGPSPRDRLQRDEERERADRADAEEERAPADRCRARAEQRAAHEADVLHDALRTRTRARGGRAARDRSAGPAASRAGRRRRPRGARSARARAGRARPTNPRRRRQRARARRRRRGSAADGRCGRRAGRRRCPAIDAPRSLPRRTSTPSSSWDDAERAERPEPEEARLSADSAIDCRKGTPSTGRSGGSIVSTDEPGSELERAHARRVVMARSDGLSAEGAHPGCVPQDRARCHPVTAAAREGVALHARLAAARGRVAGGTVGVDRRARERERAAEPRDARGAQVLRDLARVDPVGDHVARRVDAVGEARDPSSCARRSRRGCGSAACRRSSRPSRAR